MMKKFYAVVVLGFVLITVQAQIVEAEEELKEVVLSADSVDGWKKGATGVLGTAQTSLTNWSAGGENSLSVNALLSSFANLTRGKLNWDNSLDVGYGLLKQGQDVNFMKTDDKIDLLSKLGYNAFDHWNYAALVNFKTQMTDGYNYPNDSVAISKFLAPAYILGAAGLDYKPNDHFSAFIAPVTSKFTLVNDPALADSGAFGVEAGEKFRAELGGYVRMAFAKEVMENVKLATKIDLFSNYLDTPENIDVNWETLITLKANKYLSASIATHLIYDDDVDVVVTDDSGKVLEKGPRVQFKEVLSVGVTVTF